MVCGTSMDSQFVTWELELELELKLELLAGPELDIG